MKIKDFAKLKAFTVDIDQHCVAEVSLNRPDSLNSMNSDFWTELPAIIEALDSESAARVVILSSVGKHFTAGIDLSILGDLERDDGVEPARAAEKLRRWILSLQNAFTTLEKARMPVISAIQGACIGGGVDMICATDMRFCTEDAFFNIKETSLGITADVGTLQRIQHVMPSGLARELAYSSRNLEAAEAESCGFVNKVFADHKGMLVAVRQLATAIAKHSPIAVHGTKAMLNYSRDHSVEDSLNHMATWQSGMLQAPDVTEAIRSNAEKRDPVFDNLLT
ncbi:MAG: crotonase/enoyl-CoA hydratase family protein [Porticoccaceae bacterium]